MYRISGLNFTEKTDDIWDFIRDKISENDEQVEDWITSGYGEIEIPIIGRKEVGDLADEYLWADLLDEYAEYTSQVIEEEVACCGESSWSDFIFTIEDW